MGDEPEHIAAPECLDDEERAMFDSLVERLLAVHVGIVQADAWTLERAAVALVTARRARQVLREQGRYITGRDGNPVLHPAVRDERAAGDTFARAASSLGLTPLDQERLSRNDDCAEEDPLDELERNRHLYTITVDDDQPTCRERDDDPATEDPLDRLDRQRQAAAVNRQTAAAERRIDDTATE